MTEGEVSVSVALGSEVALECDVVSANPPSQIVWHTGDGTVINEIMMNNKLRFLDSRRFLYINDLAPEDLMPHYRCKVTNALLDRTVQAPTIYVLRDNLTRGELSDYKQIGDLTAFVGNVSFEFAYVGGYYGTRDVNGTENQLFQGDMRVDSSRNIGFINRIEGPGMFILRVDVTFDGTHRDRFGMLTVHRKYICELVKLLS